MNELPNELQTPMVNVLLCVADDKLFLGHRNSDWTGIAPILEADIAFSSLAQDDIAHAGAFYDLISSITGQNPDQIAFARSSNEYLCADIVTKSDEFDWANAIARQFYCNVYDFIRFQRLSKSSWTPLADLSKRLCAEQAVHVDHVSSWIDHLGNGSEESNVKMQTALDEYAPYAAKMFEAPEGIEMLIEGDVLPDEGCFYTSWKEQVDQISGPANLQVTVDYFARSLTELQEVFNSDPLAAW